MKNVKQFRDIDEIEGDSSQNFFIGEGLEIG